MKDVFGSRLLEPQSSCNIPATGISATRDGWEQGHCVKNNDVPSAQTISRQKHFVIGCRAGCSSKSLPRLFHQSKIQVAPLYFLDRLPANKGRVSIIPALESTGCRQNTSQRTNTIRVYIFVSEIQLAAVTSCHQVITRGPKYDDSGSTGWFVSIVINFVSFNNIVGFFP